MAKSLRSKSKRAVRAIARVKKSKKEDKLLHDAVARREAYELAEQAEREGQMQESSELNQEMEVDKSKATINLKTMKTANGKYPVWLNKRKQNKLQKAAKQSKKNKAKKAKGRR